MSDENSIKNSPAARQTYAAGERVDKFCAGCDEERGHVVAVVTKRGQISRVSCPKCGARSTFKRRPGASATPAAALAGAAYDRTHTYRAGQSMTHPIFGQGEVTALIGPQKIDVLFPDRIRRLVHSLV